MKYSVAVLAVLVTLLCVEHTSATCAHQPGYVYIIGEGTNYYKVGGTTRGVDTRRNELQIGNPRPLQSIVQFCVNDCYNAEEAAHAAAGTAPGANVIWINGRRSEWYQVNNINQFSNVIRNAVADHQAAEMQIFGKLTKFLFPKYKKCSA